MKHIFNAPIGVGRPFDAEDSAVWIFSAVNGVASIPGAVVLSIVASASATLSVRGRSSLVLILADVATVTSISGALDTEQCLLLASYTTLC